MVYSTGETGSLNPTRFYNVNHSVSLSSWC